MDAYKRAGRGGAGNYYSPQQIEEATNSNKGKGGQQEQDLEAQNPAASSSSFDADPLPSDPATAVATAADAEHHQAQATAAVASSRAASYANAHAPPPSSHQQQQGPPPQQIRYSGRGGAGNWTSDPAQLEYDEENKRKRQAALDAKVFNEVNTALAEPKKAYQLHPAGHIGRGRVGVAGQGGGGDLDGIDI
ncbi:hypothetical protein PG984_000380 [Apiospora sp. TS-2023a]